ncbi:MAG: hypothetical protein E6920_20720 [Clostridium sp.]|nr:hypothetical protein [Paeniclostridium sordellii]MDU1404314.1 hypothetical protein [Clostridium sp.]CEP43738.1 Uncharacterised protein [[Clostridium] sordellii] [Paeniclostridium sordellii]CEP44041.1 Uncharacterised protein [[Clostridium] sordellii] [Paeniclostridium sordellii]CEP50474.1 Uncharacterised protein [[Clostridium] sordellii] [Paeniclostridium sordellii]
MYYKKIENGWTIKIKETSDFKGIITNEKIVLFSDEEIDVYGLFKIKGDEILKIHGFYNLRYKINSLDKTIEFSFIEK